MDLFRAETTIFGPLQALVTRWSYLGALTKGGFFAEFKTTSEILANVQRVCPRLKAIFKKWLHLG